MKKLKLYKIDNEEKNEKREHGTDIPNNENNLSLISNNSAVIMRKLMQICCLCVPFLTSTMHKKK